MPGGIHVTEAAFQDACARADIEARGITFGRRRTNESPLLRPLRLIADLVGYAFRVIVWRPDVVHLNTAFDRPALVRDVGYAFVSRFLGQPLFLKYHGSDETVLADRSPLWRALTRWTIGNATLIGVLSSEEKSNFVGAGYPATRFVVVKNALNVRRFENASWPRPGFERPASGPPEPAQLLFIARLVPEKGLSDVIQAVRRLLDSGRLVVLTCVGDGPARPDAEALVRRLGLTNSVRFAGLVPEDAAARYYLESSVLVFPTYHREGFSMTVFQSLAAGLPMVTTRLRGAADHLVEPDHCLWTNPRDPEGLSARLGWLLDHPAAAEHMHRHAIARARDFDAESVAREYAVHYRRIGRRTRGAPP